MQWRTQPFLGKFFKFTTAGCGVCMDGPYCAANAAQASDEWIAAVTIGNWLQASGNGGGGYQNFTGDQTNTLELYPLTAPWVAVIPGFYAPLPNKLRIYVDFNADGDFEDAAQSAFDPGYAHNGTITGHLQVPFFTETGYTRMRVLMKVKNATNQPPWPCESFDFGQIEDYCVLLSTTSTTGRPETGSDPGGQLRVFPQPAWTTVRLDGPGDGKNAHLQVWNETGQLVASQRVAGEPLLLTWI